MSTPLSPLAIGAAALAVAGAICGLLIGSGFATGQEALQYFVAHGWAGLGSLALVTLIQFWVIYSIVEWGRQHPERIHDAFTDICGRWIGTVLQWFVPFFLFAVVVLMVSGAGALLHEMLGWPVRAGSFMIALMLAVTLMLGLRRLVDVVSASGILIILYLLVVAGLALWQSAGQLADVDVQIVAYPPPRAVDSWWLGALLYSASIMLACVPFLAGLGSTVRSSQASRLGAGLGAITASAVLLMMTLALLANLPLIHDKATPLVTLGSTLHPWVGASFAIVTFIGVYSTAAPMIWSVADLMTRRRPGLYRPVSLMLLAIALAFGSSLPFGRLVGLIYPYAGIFGVVLLLCLGRYQWRARRQTNPQPSNA